MSRGTCYYELDALFAKFSCDSVFAGDVSTKIIYQIPHLNDRDLQRDPGRTSFIFVVLIINDKETSAIDTITNNTKYFGSYLSFAAIFSN